jgi:hypothetical protein
MTEESKTGENKTEEEGRLVHPDALGRSFEKALEEDAAEQATLPKKFEKGEGMIWPLCD